METAGFWRERGETNHDRAAVLLSLLRRITIEGNGVCKYETLSGKSHKLLVGKSFDSGGSTINQKGSKDNKIWLI